MANISFFYPKAQKGTALGMNAGLGNLGVSVMQFAVPLVITAGVFGSLGGAGQTWVRGAATKEIWMQNAGYIWVPFILAATVAAWFGMNDISSAKASFAEQAVIFRRKHNWLMCWLYLGTFGSFIGYSAGFPLLIKSQFPQVDPTAYAFLGPLVGALSRPPGGWIADKLGGARVTFWNFIAHGVGGAGCASLPSPRRRDRQLLGLLRHVHAPLFHHRDRQRLDLPHDPRHLHDPSPLRRDPHLHRWNRSWR